MDNWTPFSYISDGLAIGGDPTQNPNVFPAFDAIVKLNEEYGFVRAPSTKFVLWAPLTDGPPVPSLDELRVIVEFIHGNISAGRSVLVHCAAGVSRSTTVATAFYMYHFGWSRKEAVVHVSERRKCMRPNKAFWPLLKDWERHLQGELSV